MHFKIKTLIDISMAKLEPNFIFKLGTIIVLHHNIVVNKFYKIQGQRPEASEFVYVN